MKKLICMALVLCMAVSPFAGCGRAEDATPSGTASDAGIDASADTGGDTAQPPDAGGGGGIPADGGIGGGKDAGIPTGFITGYGDKYADPSLSATGRKIVDPETGPVGTWSIPVPFINPLGSQKLYTGGSDFKATDAIDIQYIDNFTEFRQRLFGDRWYLAVNDENGLPMRFLKAYAEQLGATVYASAYDDRLIFRVRQPDAIWWCDAVEGNNRYELRILRQDLYEVGKEYTFPMDRMGNFGGADVAFVTESTGEKFQTLKVGIQSGKVRIFGECVDQAESTVYRRVDVTLDSKVSRTFLLDNIPQGAGQMSWKLVPHNKETPVGLTFKLEESYDIPAVKMGAEPGALLVKGAPFGSVFVRAQRFVDYDWRESGQRDLYSHDQETRGTITPEGDTLFILPPGLWTVVNRAPYMNYGSTNTQLVPVNTGEKTTVVLPASLKSANTRLNGMADDSELTGGVEVVDAVDRTETAEISVSVSDPLDRDIQPTADNTTIYEGASKVSVTDIRRVVAPCSIALVIDSSGSMKKDMKAVLDAAKTFLGGLPAGSFVKVVDFDAKVSVLKGETPADAVKALASITAGGQTKLYDATQKGLEVVTGKTRPAVVVFTDGVDSREDKTGNGSVSTREAVTQKIRDAKIPVYTIGFGKRLNEQQAASGAQVDGVPDIQCLLGFASAAGGQYYPAKDPAALTGVFAAISSKLGNHFVITYNRPTERNLSETPFLSMVVDNSGSMNTDPKEGKDCNYRMEKTIGLFHDFLAKVPDRTMMQFTTFQTPIMSPDLIIQQQITTQSKAHILKSLGEMDAKGGTPVVLALRTAYENLVPVPSSRKAILLLTDGGLEVEPEQKDQFTDLLAKIREKNINVLFVGMGVGQKEALFADAAKACGGDCVISENVDEIGKKLDGLINTLKETTPSPTIPLSLTLRWTTPEGETLEYGVSDEVAFAQPAKEGPPLEPDVVRITTGEPWHRYDKAVSAAVTGEGAPGTDNIVTGRLAFDKAGENKAMSLHVGDAVVLSRLMGVDTERAGKQFVALELELENRTEKGIPYEIPSIFKHFYLGVNDAGIWPASKATWLVNQPLTGVGDPQVTVKPGEKKRGVLVFAVPESPGFTRMSLHFFDTDYGHIQMALTGKPSDAWKQLAALPASAPAKLSDTFSLQVSAASQQVAVDRYKAAEMSTFQVVEGRFQSSVQALINFDPRERIWLNVDTQSGSLMSRLSNATQALPFGFLEPAMVGAAASNPVRMAFDLPWLLGKAKSSLYFDIAGGKAEVPVTAGSPYGAPKAAATVDGPGVRIIVNQLVANQAALSFNRADGTMLQDFGDNVLLDVTVQDLPGNEGTRIPSDFFCLVNKNYKAPSGTTAGRVGLGGGGGESNANLLTADRQTQDLVYGIDSTFGVFEGQSRRGIVVFRKPGGNAADWTLQSPYMETLSVPLAAGTFASPELLGWKTSVETDKAFEETLDAAVRLAVARHRTVSGETDPNWTQIGLTEDDGRQTVPMPSLSTHGQQVLAGVTTEEQVYALMQSLRCLPVNRDGGYLLYHGYEPEAVVSQGWGDIGDMTNLAMSLFSRLGFSPEPRVVALTEKGRNLIKEQTGVDTERVRTIPIGIAYRNAAGERRLFVVPFMMDISGLKGLVYFQQESQGNYLNDSGKTVLLRVSVRYEPGVGTGSAAGKAGDAGSALGGGEGGSAWDELTLLETEKTLSGLSVDALDLCFMKRTGTGGTDGYVAVLSGPDGVDIGETVLENPKRVLGVKVEIERANGNQGTLTHEDTLGDGDSLEKCYETISINQPGLTRRAAAALDGKVKAVYNTAKNPDPISIARWYGRSILYRYISGESMFENEMTSKLGVVAGRLDEPRCLVVTSHLDKAGTMQTTIDLMQPWTQVHAGAEDAVNAYQTVSGFYLSQLEAEVLPGDNQVGYLELWARAPAGTIVQAIPCVDGNRDALHADMVKSGKYPARLLDAVKRNELLLFVPTAPTVWNGQERWAWLEVDPETYQAIAVFDTGLHGGMTEFKLALLPSDDDTIKWMKGIWVGTNMSVWTMCSSTLKYGDNYEAVLIDAKKTAYECAEIVDKFMEFVEAVQNMEMKFSVPVGGAGSHEIEVKIGMSGIKGEFKQKLYSYAGGMKLAIDAYFDAIVPQPDDDDGEDGAGSDGSSGNGSGNSK